jgi:hypothetical protein
MRRIGVAALVILSFLTTCSKNSKESKNSSTDSSTITDSSSAAA